MKWQGSLPGISQVKLPEENRPISAPNSRCAGLRNKKYPVSPFPVKLGKGKEKLELEILEEIVQQNYIRIISDVNAILNNVADRLKNQTANTTNQRKQ